jgi:hypothetical protein
MSVVVPSLISVPEHPSTSEDSVKVLIATRRTQGARDDDFSATVEGELVFDGGPCEDAVDAANWTCPCAIAFHGVASGELTTTAVVADLPITLGEYERAVRDGTEEWCCPDCARFYADSTRMLALRFPVGTVIERFRDEIRVRSFPSFPSAPSAFPALPSSSYPSSSDPSSSDPSSSYPSSSDPSSPARDEPDSSTD